MERGKLIGIIHQQKAKALVCDSCGNVFFSTDRCPKCLALGHRIRDEEYRSFLELWSGKRSCSQMDETELQMVANAFDEAGYESYWKKRKAQHNRRRAQMVQIIKREAERTLGDGWADRLDGFVDKVVGKQSLYSLDDKELRQVIGWLRRLKSRAMDNDRF